VLGGVSPSDQVVINPADSLENGQQVNVAQPQNPSPQNGTKEQPSQQKGSGS
jgi:hypothetical protein